MSYQYIKGAVSTSIATSYTGSFVKILALGADDTECSLERIEFGQLVQPESSFTPTGIINTEVKIPAGSYIDGPIARFKVSGSAAAGGFLAYYSD